MAAEQKLYALMNTNKGLIKIEMFEKEAPNTVTNFVELAEGTKAWRDPKTGQQVKRPFYDGLIFHRVIQGFMVQGGCPQGNGYGGPGYSFADEFHRSLRHNKVGRLSMANSGPNTNGSQFFLTVAQTPHLDNRHTVFGQVVEGLNVLLDISRVPTLPNDRPRDPVIIEKLTFVRE